MVLEKMRHTGRAHALLIQSIDRFDIFFVVNAHDDFFVLNLIILLEYVIQCSYCMCNVLIQLGFSYYFSLLVASINPVSYLINTKTKRLVQVVSQVSFYSTKMEHKKKTAIISYVVILRAIGSKIKPPQLKPENMKIKLLVFLNTHS